MSDNLKPCKWRENTGETKPEFIKAWCTHPLSLHIAAFERCGKLVAACHGCPCHEPQPVVKESLTTQPDPTPTGGKTGTGDVCWHTPIRQNPFTGALDMKSECGHTITADEEDKRFVPPTTCLRCGKPRRFKL